MTITGDDDLIDEAAETVLVDITSVSPMSQMEPVQQQTITITDDDVAPTVSIAVAPASITENGGVSTVEATLSAITGLDVTVDLTYTGTATVVLITLLRVVRLRSLQVITTGRCDDHRR